MAVMKVLYKPLALVLGITAGLAATAVFKRVWRLAAHQEDAPDATDEDRSWGEALTVAALQGAVSGVAKALVSRGGATGIRQLTGKWPA